MVQIKVNKKMLPIKLHYFIFYGCIGPIVGFLPTIVKQLGYSLTTYGTTMMFLSLKKVLLAPLIGAIVDNCRVKKLLFLTAITGLALASFFFTLLPKVPINTSMEFKCETETIMTINTETVQKNTPNNVILIDNNFDELITCKLNCEDIKLYNMKNQYNLSGYWMSTINDFIKVNRRNQIDVTLKLNDTEHIESSYIFHPLSIEINGKQIPQITCQWRLKTFCHVDCSNKGLTDVVNVRTFRGNVLKLYQYWIFVIVTLTYGIFVSVTYTLQNPICLNNLGDKTEDYGKQKCWASAGWGFFSIFMGWLLDFISTGKKEKNYSPLFYSCMVLTTINLYVSNKIKIVETKQPKGGKKNVFGLFNKSYVIAFFIWAIFNAFFHSIITHFLFWYMDDMVAVNHDYNHRVQIKTLQGLVQGVQCFGGEIPFFFWSGWIIKKLGHVNCMSVVLGAMAVRMFLYTIVSDPFWIIFIELLNGVSYALGYAVQMSYAKMISTPDTIFTIIGFIGCFECVGDSLGSLTGGYVFDSYGGKSSFRFFAYSSALMCFLNILSNTFGLSKEVKKCDFIAVSTDVNKE